MNPDFYRNREYLSNEFEEAVWLPDSGLEPEALLALLTEFQQQHPDLPSAVLRARCFALMLQNIQIGINPHGLFSWKLNHGVTYKPFAGGGVFDKFWGSRYHRVSPQYMPEVWERRLQASGWGVSQPDSDFWHTAPDWNEILRLGFPGLLDRAEQAKRRKQEEGLLTAQSEAFYDAVILSYRAILDCVSRMAGYAEKAECHAMAASLENLTKAPPATLYEVMQLSLLYLEFEEMGIERCRTMGLIDRLYRPYYQSDVEEGRLTPEDARELFRYYFERLSAAKRYADQPIGIGGVYPDGTDTTTEFSYLLLETYEELGIHNPKIHVRCHKGMPRRLLNQLLSMIRNGNSSVVLINDETVYRGYEKIGIPRSLSVHYVPIGCYEPVIMGVEDARIGAAWLNIAKAVDLAMHGGVDPLKNGVFGIQTDPAPADFEAFYALFLQHLRYILEFTMENILLQLPYQNVINPSPIYSGTIASCVESGRDVFDNGMLIRNDSIKCFAIGTTVDSLLAVKKFVYEDKAVTFKELASILKNNWSGAEKLRLQILADKNKWGNGLEEPDRLARDIYRFIAGIVVNRPNGRGGVFRLATDSVNHDAIYGKNTGATPDGRLAGEPLTKNMRPTNGLERGGITGLVKSVTAIDHTDMVDAAPLDFILHPSAVAGPKGLEAMAAIVKVYFDRGGFAIQGNVVNSETLRDAQKNPDRYRNLQVRVCGWNEYFVNMSRLVQDDFIKRAEGTEAV